MIFFKTFLEGKKRYFLNTLQRKVITFPSPIYEASIIVITETDKDIYRKIIASKNTDQKILYKAMTFLKPQENIT